MFVTTPEFLAQHREQTRRLLERATASGQLLLAEMNQQVLAKLDRIIAKLEAGEDLQASLGEGPPVRADDSRFLVQAAHWRSQATRKRAIQALRRLVAAGELVSFDSVARAAGVSCSWLYAQPDLRLKIGRLRAHHQQEQERASSAPSVPARQRASDASLRQRLEAVNAEIRRLRQENRQLREQLAWALGGAPRGHAPRTVRLDDDRSLQLTRVPRAVQRVGRLPQWQRHATAWRIRHEPEGAVGP